MSAAHDNCVALFHDSHKITKDITMTTTINPSPNTEIGGAVKEYFWNYQEQKYKIVYETLGAGTPILLLPAFSTVSTRAEMGQLAKLLAHKFQVVAVDWLGFGESSRPHLNYCPDIYHQFLHDFIADIFNTPIVVVAAGHAAGYVMQLAVTQPDVFSKIILVAPTWRGPLPTMIGKPQAWMDVVREIVRLPLLGQALYKLNTTPSFLHYLHYMYRSHVYTNPAKLTPEFVTNRWRTTQQPGARYAPAAFVTGRLDPVRDAADQTWFQGLSIPVLVVIGEQTPPKSKAAMETLAKLPHVQTQTLPGSLGLHDEYPQELAQAILPFLQ